MLGLRHVEVSLALVVTGVEAMAPIFPSFLRIVLPKHDITVMVL